MIPKSAVVAVMPSIPVDVLLLILEHVDMATLVTMCKVNQVCCSCSQDVLYREIRIYKPSEFRICQTLAQSAHLARRVRSFKTCHIHGGPDPNLHGALQNMINLHHLDSGYCNIFNLLEGCTFTLVSFSCAASRFQQPLYQFLLGQPSLTAFSLMIFINIDDWPEFGATCLPNLTRVTAPFSKLPQLIPNRPLKEVMTLGHVLENNPTDLSFFTLSNSPIQKLTIDCSYLYPTVEILIMHMVLVHKSNNASLFGGNHHGRRGKCMNCAYCIMHRPGEGIMHYEVVWRPPKRVQ
jgi:hypothetical protein